MGAWLWGGLAASFARFDVDITLVEPAELRNAFTDLSARAARAAGS